MNTGPSVVAIMEAQQGETTPPTVEHSPLRSPPGLAMNAAFAFHSVVMVDVFCYNPAVETVKHPALLSLPKGVLH